MAKRESERPLTFFEELRRRRVVGSSIAYVVVAWVLIQVADIVGPAFSAPDWIVRAIATLALLLFPVFLVLSWEFDLTRRGLEHTGDDRDVGFSARPWVRRGMVALVSIGSLLAIYAVWTSGVITQEIPDKENSFPKTIAVDDFQAFTNEESAWLGAGTAALVRDNLAQSRFLNVVSLRRWAAVRGSDETDTLTAAAGAGITYLVQGEIIGNRQGHLLTVRLTDTRDGEQLDAQTFEVNDDASLLDRATAIAQGTRARLQVPLEERVDAFAADFAAENPSSYRAFIGALDYWINFEHLEAERLLNAALELQPNFAMARYYLAWNLASQDRLDEATKALPSSEAIENDRDRHYVDAMRLLLDRDTLGAAESYAALVEQYPNDTEARQLLAETWYQAYDTEQALQNYQVLADLEPELQTGWSGVAYLQVELGNLEAAQPAIERFAEIDPDNPNVYSLRGNLNRALGNFGAARNDYTLALEKGPELLDSKVLRATTEYLDGNADIALAELDQLIRDQAAVPRYRMDAAFAAGGLLAIEDRHQEYFEYLTLLDDVFVASDIFHAKALSDKALALLETGGSLEEAKALANAAVAASPGVATRYLLTRALVEIAAGEFSQAVETAAAIRALALPPEDPDRTEDKAADFVEGLVARENGDLASAIQLFTRATDAAGYDYRHYGLTLARLLIDQGETGKARPYLDKIGAQLDFANPRLDLEADRLASIELLKTL